MANVKPVQFGVTTRMSFSKIKEVLEMPYLIEVQKNSYEWFLKEGLKEVLKDVSAITDFTGNLVLEFIDYKLGGGYGFSKSGGGAVRSRGSAHAAAHCCL